MGRAAGLGAAATPGDAAWTGRTGGLTVAGAGGRNAALVAPAMDTAGLRSAGFAELFWAVAGFLAPGFAAFFLGAALVRDGIVFLRVT
jgi:hypothetical protein